jgi:hypothetical protein
MLDKLGIKKGKWQIEKAIMLIVFQKKKAIITMRFQEKALSLYKI